MNSYETWQLKKYGDILKNESFCKDMMVMPVNQQEDEEAYLTEQEKAIAWSEFEYEMQLMERENT